MQSPNLRLCQARSQNRELSRASGPAHPPPETGRQGVGGNQSQKGAMVAPERHHLPNCKQALLLTKTTWDSGWSTSAGRVAARDQLPRRDTRHTWEGASIVHSENQAAGTGEAIRCTPYLGVTALTKDLVTWAARTWEGHQTQAQPSLHLCGAPENLSLSNLDLGSKCNPGPASDSSRQSSIEPEKCRMKAHTQRAGANPGRLKPCEHFPYTPVVFVCSVAPSWQHDWTSKPEKVTTITPLCQGRN